MWSQNVKTWCYIDQKLRRFLVKWLDSPKSTIKTGTAPNVVTWWETLILPVLYDQQKGKIIAGLTGNWDKDSPSLWLENLPISFLWVLSCLTRDNSYFQITRQGNDLNYSSRFYFTGFKWIQTKRELWYKVVYICINLHVLHVQIIFHTHNDLMISTVVIRLFYSMFRSILRSS